MVSLRDYVKIFFRTIQNDKHLLLITIIYGAIASVFNLTLPLSIQYISTQIMTNASMFPVIIIAICLLIFLGFYGVLKVFQLIAFSYFEKRFFITKSYQITKYLHDNQDKFSPSTSIQTYTEITNTILNIGNFVFATSILIQQIFLGLILTSFYHLSFLVFNIILIVIIFLIFKFFFLRSITLYRRELDIRYAIGATIKNSTKDFNLIDGLLGEYYIRKTSYFNNILKQNIIFFGIYAFAHCLFLLMSGFLTLKGYITIPQFLASEIIFSLVFATLGEFTKNLKNIYELLNSTKKIDEILSQSDNIDCSHLNIPQTPKFHITVLKIIIIFFWLVTSGLFIMPWYQTSFGEGKIIAYNQDDRVQDITAMVSGRIVKWYVNDGQFLKQGDKIAEIADNDPELITKLENELQSIKIQYENAQLSTQTAEINYNRQYELYKKGLSARKEFEKAKIEYQKLLSYENEVKAKLIQTDVKFARQKSQIIVAPKDGFLLHSKAKSASSYVYAGDVIATFVPDITDPVMEVFLQPNDMPLIHVGRKARIQIEGWPALRISGWPATALGTFGGVVKIVDRAASPNGMFRVIIAPDPQDSPWPDMKYIKQGTKVITWVRMNKVPIGYEIWRQINGFPITPDEHLFLKNDKDKK